MGTDNPTVWGVFVGGNGDQLEIFNSNQGPFPPDPGSEGWIAIGWPAIGDLLMFSNDYLGYVDKFRVVYPLDDERVFKTTANMPWNFAFSMKIDDWVICPSSASGLLLVGTIIGEYENDFQDKTGLYGRRRVDFVHLRKVRWDYVVKKSDPAYSKLNRIGQLTISRRDITVSDLTNILQMPH